MDPTLKRSRSASIIVAAISVLMVPATWMFAFDALPTLQAVRAETSGGRLGPWVFAWVIVWIATVSCLSVAWICYATLDERQ